MIVVEYFVVGFVVVVFVGPSQLWEEELFHPLTGQVNLEYKIFQRKKNLHICNRKQLHKKNRKSSKSDIKIVEIYLKKLNLSFCI